MIRKIRLLDVIFGFGIPLTIGNLILDLIKLSDVQDTNWILVLFLGLCAGILGLLPHFATKVFSSKLEILGGLFIVTFLGLGLLSRTSLSASVCFSLFLIVIATSYLRERMLTSGKSR